MGWVISLLIGLTLGLLGGGGSILTVPLLVYVFGVPVARATGLSLFVVGITSALGAAGYAIRGEVDWRMAAKFGIPATTVALVTRVAAVPFLPPALMGIERDRMLLLLFAGLMLVVSHRMIRPAKNQMERAHHPVVLGVAVGAIAGLLGAGGGFLIVPALALVAAMPMKTAIGTSLFIIAIQSLTAFAGESWIHPIEDWTLLAGVTTVAAVGLLLGLRLSRLINGGSLRPIFGWFVAATAIGIVSKELLLTGILS